MNPVLVQCQLREVRYSLWKRTDKPTNTNMLKNFPSCSTGNDLGSPGFYKKNLSLTEACAHDLGWPGFPTRDGGWVAAVEAPDPSP